MWFSSVYNFLHLDLLIGPFITRHSSGIAEIRLIELFRSPFNVKYADFIPTWCAWSVAMTLTKRYPQESLDHIDLKKSCWAHWEQIWLQKINSREKLRQCYFAKLNPRENFKNGRFAKLNLCKIRFFWPREN